MHARRRGVERAEILRRHDADHRGFDRIGAHRLEAHHEIARLLLGPRHEDALAEERPRVEPAQMIAQRHDAADDEHRRPAIVGSLHDLGDLLERAGARLLRRQRAVVHDRGRFVRRASVRDQ